MRTAISFTIAMMVVMMGVLSPLGAANKLGKSSSEAYGFHAAKGMIQVVIRPQQTQLYKGREMAFYTETGEKVCVWENQTCPQEFLGAVRPVWIEFSSSDGKALPEGLVLREKVSLLSQSQGLLDRKDYEISVPVVKGIASDLQVWGHDEVGLKSSTKKDSRKAFEGASRILRQELFLGNADFPFAVLTWRQAASAIEIIDVRQIDEPVVLSASR